MILRFVPQERGFYDLFCRDIEACKKGVAQFTAMLNDYTDLKAKADLIHETEHEGDRITAEIFALINKTFVTPFEREDVIALGSIIDTVLDGIDEVATMLVLYRIEKPDQYLLDASVLLGRMADELVAAMGKLNRFKGLQPHIDNVHTLEIEADGLYYKAIDNLFTPGGFEAVDVIKWKSVYDLMERAFDKCEDVANVLENVVLKNG